METAIIIVDHGSRNAESNELLNVVAQQFAAQFARHYSIVEPAHMELAGPTIEQAFARCVARGAWRVVVCPYFLGPGKHWTVDIPRLVAAAALSHPGVEFEVTAPLGVDDLILKLLAKRIEESLKSSKQAAAGARS
jgi:sirohydrochlorin ferrochelatase